MKCGFVPKDMWCSMSTLSHSNHNINAIITYIYDNLEVTGAKLKFSALFLGLFAFISLDSLDRCKRTGMGIT